MATLNNNSSITTTQIRVGWTSAGPTNPTSHNFVMTNLNDGPVRITVTPNNGLEFSVMDLGNHGGNSVNHHSLVGESFTLEGDSGLLLRLTASAIDSTAINNTVTFTSETLHTGIRNNGSVLIALQADVAADLINA